MGSETGAARAVGDTDHVRIVAEELSKLMLETGLSRTLLIGGLVLERFFGGSVQRWRDRRRNKNNSVRRLAECPQCPISRSALNQAIAVYSALQELPRVRELRQIGPSHVNAVLALPKSEHEQWLLLANDERWSVRRLTEEIRAHRRQCGERRGRPHSSAAAKVVTRVKASIRAVDSAVSSLRGVLPDLDDATLSELAERCAGLESDIRDLLRVRRDSQIVVRAREDISRTLLKLG
jgi:hypothetical protein